MYRRALKLFRIAGIQVYLHFSWFIVAVFEVTYFAKRYQSPVWGVFEYLALFFIVLLHEFGHALACRQTGGRADRIILWPLGGIAYVDPPFRPGAYLWSIAAGPLVNVFLFPILGFLLFTAAGAQWNFTNPDLYRFIDSLFYINSMLLIFNLLPVYPLDGGQILRSLLWFKMGPIRSLKIASVIGFLGATAFALFAFQQGSIWFGVLAFFIFIQAQVGWRQAQALAVAGKMPPDLPTVTTRND